MKKTYEGYISYAEYVEGFWEPPPRWFGKWEVIAHDRTGKELWREEIRPNLIEDDGLNMFRDILRGTVTDGKIKYVALGNDSTAPANEHHQLVAEQFRKPVTSQNPDPITAGKLYTEVYIADTEANAFKCEEIGWFAGATATATANSGIMIARVLYSRQKLSTESWTIRRTDTIARG